MDTTAQVLKGGYEVVELIGFKLDCSLSLSLSLVAIIVIKNQFLFQSV